MAIPSAKSGRSDGGARGFWRRLLRAAQALDEHWIGDLIGALCLFGLLWVGLVAGAVLQ